MIIHATHKSFEHRIVLVTHDGVVIAAPAQLDFMIDDRVSTAVRWLNAVGASWKSFEKATR